MPQNASTAALPRTIIIASRIPLFLIFLLALSLRVLTANYLMGTIDSEGAEYARIAENLLNGTGYVGIIAWTGKELWFPPLFPLLIASVTMLTHSSELAGHLISVTTGALLVLPVFLITLHLYDHTVAYVAALLVAVHPLLVGFGGTVYGETIYMTLVLSGAYWGLRCLTVQKARDFLLAGMFFGLAYLTRPEAALYPLLTTFLFASTLLIDRRWQWNNIKRVCLLLAVFVIIASPYSAWLSVQTGQFRWEGKSPSIYAKAAAQILADGTADVSIGQDLQEQGAGNRPMVSVIKETKFELKQIIQITYANTKRNLPRVLTEISSLAFGSLFLIGMVFLGLFSSPWGSRLVIGNCYLIFVVLGVVSLGLASVAQVGTRYVLLFLPVMSIWASRGIVQISRWAGGTAMMAGIRAAASKKLSMVFGLTFSAALLLISLYGTNRVWQLTVFDYKSRPVKEAGKWLNSRMPGPKTVMDASSVLAFEAGGTWVPFPYADGSLVLEYIQQRRINFIAFRDDWLSPMPYVKDWLDNGIPDQRAQLIYSDKTERGRILIYEWTPSVIRH
jgi:4-amino-4-deoxy-L-arabinose transferase-like glycosyltransferase